MPRGSALRLGCPCKTQPLGGGSRHEERQGHAPHEVVSCTQGRAMGMVAALCTKASKTPCVFGGRQGVTCPVASADRAKGCQPPSRQSLEGGIQSSQRQWKAATADPAPPPQSGTEGKRT